jgi:hypothetical protein
MWSVKHNAWLQWPVIVKESEFFWKALYVLLSCLADDKGICVYRKKLFYTCNFLQFSLRSGMTELQNKAQVVTRQNTFVWL